MLPVSGAPQFVASGAITGDQPMISATDAYSRLVSPASSGWKRFHSPRARLRLELLEHRRQGVVVVPAGGAPLVVDRLGGEDALAHEVPHPAADVLGSGGQGEVHAWQRSRVGIPV
jgi:hypothetical protein